MDNKELNKYLNKSLENFIKELATNPEKVFDNEELQIKYNNLLKEKIKLQSNWNILKELIRWKPIEEYDENKYDWVLVKYYDGDYECVPTVAERRKGTNKWYDTNNNEIIFEIKYFFDMQLLDKMNELERTDK